MADREAEALGQAYEALSQLDRPAQRRGVAWLNDRLSAEHQAAIDAQHKMDRRAE